MSTVEITAQVLDRPDARVKLTSLEALAGAGEAIWFGFLDA
jgi:hypothetical protein